MKQILIAEDESRIAAFLEKGFRKYGFTVAIARDGQEAIKLTQKQPFDLLLLDLDLPVIDGWTVLKQLRAQGDSRPIIIITAQDDENQKAMALKIGASDYITKPLRFKALLTRVQTQLVERYIA
ncbi:MAG: response regulator [Trichocoleus desertorum ATA4-8-CV12]|jgi:DNA-binding response OmpR family regulator|nr:response regulator [Trichocoleus desertorum ATA4-8-CV12]